jgi:hypothetical protein
LKHQHWQFSTPEGLLERDYIAKLDGKDFYLLSVVYPNYGPTKLYWNLATGELANKISEIESELKTGGASETLIKNIVSTLSGC